MIAFNNFDMAKSFCIDYMHGILLGITKNMISFWTSTQNKHKPFYITKKKRELLDLRLQRIKTPSYISRPPRSLKYMENYKASEYRSLLLFYLPIIIEGLLPSKYIHHFNLLSSSVYLLLKSTIPNNALTETERNLKIFVKQYEEFYGEVSMTMNVHSLLHLVNCVRDFGPLWSFSMFPFESYNGLLKSFVVAPTDILHQISLRYMCYKTINCKREKEISETALFKNEIDMPINPHYMDAIEEAGLNQLTEIKCYSTFKKKGILYTSTSYTKAKKTTDYFVSILEEMLGAVHFYFLCDYQRYAIIERLDKCESLYQFIRFKFTGEYAVITADQINDIYIKIESLKQNYLVKRPNSFERN